MTATREAGYIRPEIAHLAVPIGQVREHPRNPRDGDPDRLRQSLHEYGQYQTLLVQRSTGYVVKGNNTLEAMRAAGYTHAAVQMLDLSDDDALGMALMDNWTSDVSTYDRRVLAQALSTVEDWDKVGWKPEDLDDVLAGLEADGVNLDALLPDPDHPPDSTANPFDSGPAAAHPDPDRDTGDGDGDGGAGVDAPAPPRPARRDMLEMVLRLDPDDKAEALRLIDAGREWLGADLTAGQLCLRALRTLAAVGDSRHAPTDTLEVRALLLAAGDMETL